MKIGKYKLASLVIAATIGLGVSSQTVSAKKKDSDKGYDIQKILDKLNGKGSKLSPKKTIIIDVFLKPKNEAKLSSQIYAVNTPGTSDFKHFYTPQRFAQEFGQSEQTANQFKRYFTKYKLSTHRYQNGLVLRIKGKVSNINRALNTNLQTARYHENPVQFSAKKPKMPKSLSQHVLAILGITNFNPKANMAKFINHKKQKQAQHKQKVFSKYAPTKFTRHYNLDSLSSQGQEGQGQTMGIITFAGFNKQDVSHFWKHENVPASTKRVSIKKLANPVATTSDTKTNKLETTLDVEQAGAVAPKANVRVYQANFNDVGLVNTFATAFDENKAQSLSMSWGISEYMTHYLKTHKMWTPEYAKIMNIILAQGALQGVSTFVASGDSGAYNQGVGGKIGPFSIPNFNTYANFPSDSPWVTSTGGTTLPFKKKLAKDLSIDVKRERTWGGDYMYPAFQKRRSFFTKNIKNALLLTKIFAGGGGGISSLYNTPLYQEQVPGVNTFNARQYLSITLQPKINPVLVSGTDYGRNYPDLSANADPMTGYQMYQKSLGGWNVIGGTSVVAPQFSGATAVMNSGRTSRMGFWNPQIYKLAQDKINTPFTVLDSTTNNSNLYYTGQPGKPYNQASGLGTVNFEKLFSTFK